MALHKQPGNACLWCGYTANVTRNFDGQTRPPEPGDFSMCAACGGCMIVTEDGGRRKPTEEEAGEIDADARMILFRTILRIVGELEESLRHSANARNN